jgi:hypothetical protein
MKSTMERFIKNWSEAAGKSIPCEIDLSIVTACLVKRVDLCANTTANTKHEVHIGTSLSNALASSTSLMLHTFPSSFEPFGASRALLRNLLHYKIQIAILEEFW